MDFLADTSYKQSQAEVIGSLTAAPVATGSQLVGYSGFSNEAFIREPYSADLDFGTGEWCASAWVNIPTSLPSFPSLSTEYATRWTSFTPVLYGSNTSSFDPGTGTWTVNYVNESRAFVAYVSAYDTGFLYTSVVGKRIRLTVEAKKDGPYGPRINYGGIYQLTDTWTTYTIELTSTSDGSYFYVDNMVSGSSIYLRNMSVREIGALNLLDRGQSSGSRISCHLTPIGYLATTAYDGTITRTATTTSAYNTGTWLKVDTYYKTDGSLSIAVNGQQVATTGAQTPLLTLNNSNAVLTIGNNYSLNAPFPGSIALLKLSATVPTTEQLQWMYEQEKQMFQSGVQITLPNTENILDLTYDDVTRRVIVVSTSTESYWSGLVRVAAAPASTSSAYTRVAASSGIRLVAQSTTDSGVYISRATSGLNSQLNSRAVPAANRSALLTSYDYVGGVTAISTSGSTVLTSVTGLSVPAAVNLAGTRITGTGIVTGTTITSVVGNAIYLSTATTVSTSSVQVSFVDFPLPIGYETRAVLVAGTAKQEGASATWTRSYDGFRESVTFGTAPGYNVWVQIQAVKSSS